MASPYKWNYSTRSMHRLCHHGITHPDPDDIDYQINYKPNNKRSRRELEDHECDGCCKDEGTS